MAKEVYIGFLFVTMKRVWLVGALLCVFSLSAFAQDLHTSSRLQERYAEIRLKYLDTDDQEIPLRDLLEEAEAYKAQHPESAAAWVACARIRMGYANTQGFGGLRILKTVRDEFEQAISLDRRAQDGFAPIFLGFLYSIYPRRPFSIGDKARGRELVEEAMTINATNMANNYYYALYLATAKQNDKAREYLLKARDAAEVNPAMPLIQKFLEREIGKALQNVSSD